MPPHLLVLCRTNALTEVPKSRGGDESSDSRVFRDSVFLGLVKDKVLRSAAPNLSVSDMQSGTQVSQLFTNTHPALKRNSGSCKCHGGRPWGVELGFPNYPIRMPMHLLDSKALSSLGLFYLIRILSRKPTHTFILQILEIEPAVESLEKLGWARLCFGISGLSRRRERGCRGSSADLVPTSWPLRSESALGSVALSSSQTQGHAITRGSPSQGGGDAVSLAHDMSG